ncbi:MBL fold metallo-hydrolase [candidate division KSB1 bacterium]
MFKRYVCSFLLFLSILFCLSFSRQSDEIEVIRVTPNLYKFHRFPVSFLAYMGDDGVLLSDMADIISKEQLQLELKKLGNDNVKYIINTHWHHDHTFGNKLFGKSSTIISHESVLKWLSKDQELMGDTYKAFPEYALPDITFTNNMKLYFNAETIELTHLPNCHTDGDIIVFFKDSNILHIGDIIISDFMFPSVDIERGGSVRGLARGLQEIIKIMPENVRIITGHIKNDYSIEDLKKHREMILATIDIVDQSIKKGLSLEDMKRLEILKNWKNWETPVTKCNDWLEYIYYDITVKK